ncbi:hypothetical protein J2S00_000652 [Caldalkalibacillus uzonensis]|uniref:Uncharacterized protein n=1 Tax=Caldalkalibacillus uzonensis TaxID=353224 RepID=A0ABU0CN69_9BACI|nr:hypothetical protein [Caldalkalibacillus uzonensis]
MSEKTWRWLVGLSCLYLIIALGIKVKRPDLFDSFYIYICCWRIIYFCHYVILSETSE